MRAAFFVTVALAAALAWACGSRPMQERSGQRAWLPPHGPKVSVDVHAPLGSSVRAPLVVLLQGNDPSQPDERLIVASNVGEWLRQKGVTTAAVSFNVREGHSLRACAADVAAIVNDATRAYDPTRLVFIGRGLGAWMASMLALDRRLLESAGVDPTRVDGVIAARGTYDVRDEESPTAFARADAPPFLLLSGAEDDARWAQSARAFARALRRAGARDVDDFLVPDRDAHGIMDWRGADNDLGDLVAGFVASGPRELPIDNPFGVLRRWGVQPPLDLADFRKDPTIIKSYPFDDRLRETLSHLFGRDLHELSPLPNTTYEAIDLLDYLSRRPEAQVGRGDWLVVSNIRGETQYFAREALERTRPVIVVGLDDEDNLYRLFTWYRMKREYSWIKREAPMPVMIRPLGAFLHFRAPPPDEMDTGTYASFALDARSIHWVDQDPLAPVRSLTAGVRDAMIGSPGCLTCHSFRGAGARAHHTLAESGEPYGAYALSLEEYPTDVLRRFLFDQENVADSFGVMPVPLERKVAQDLFDTVEREKAARP